MSNKLLIGYSKVSAYPDIPTQRQTVYADIKRKYHDWPGSLYDLHNRGLSKPKHERVVPWWIAQACLGYEPQDNE